MARPMRCVVLVLVAAVAAAVRLSRDWAYVGPFPIGKTELDADGIDLAAALAARQSSAAKFPSELVAGGGVGWTPLRADGAGAVRVEPAGVDWNTLVRTTNRMEVLEHQGWAVGELTVSGGPTTRVRVACKGATVFYVQPAARNDSASLAHGAGDIYGSGRIALYAALAPGAYRVVVRVRAKVQTAFSCDAVAVPRDAAPLEVRPPVAAPDVVDDWLWGTHLAVPVTNAGGDWLRSVRCDVTVPGLWRQQPEGGSGDDNRGHLPDAYPLAPGQLLMLPCRLPAQAAPLPACGEGGQIAVTVTVTAARCPGGAACETVTAPPVAHQLRCRRLDQSAVLTFRDHDGSVQSAAAVAPLPLGSLPPPQVETVAGGKRKRRTLAAAGPGDAQLPPLTAAAGPADAAAVETVPLLLTLHGTGVSAQSQADAYKVMPPGSAADYTFGVEGYWLLAPSRHGAHNHQGTGHWHALAAVDALVSLVGRVRALAASAAGSGGSDECSGWRGAMRCLPLPDGDRLLVSGHSMGGAGAWHAATAVPDRVIAAAPLAGWLVKEGYGDANSFMSPYEAGEHHADPRLKGVLLAAVHDQRSDAHAGALGGVPTHVRVGGDDATTPPLMSRRMVRLLTEAGAGAPPEAAVAAAAAAGGSGAISNYRARWPRYEEVSGKGHWWWDTVVDNDGGVVNDGVLRAFYGEQRTRLSSRRAAALAAGGGVNATAFRGTLPTAFTVVSSNAHVYASGRGGLRILQLRTPGSRATADVAVLELAAAAAAAPRVWRVSTHNVARLRWDAPGGGGLVAADQPCATSGAAPAAAAPGVWVAPSGLCVDGAGFALSPSAPAEHDLCLDGGRWLLCRRDGRDDDHTAAVAPDGTVAVAPGGSSAADWGFERTQRGPHNAGPMRAVASAPFYIVFGTGGPPEATAAYQAAAAYLSQLHASAYDALVPVVADVDLSASCDKSSASTTTCLPPGHNLVLLGPPHHNRWTAALYCGASDAGAAAIDAYRAGCARSPAFPLRFSEPAADAVATWASFSLNTSRSTSHKYAAPGQCVLATVGWWRDAPSGSGARLALVLAATDADGLWAALRLGEPTIPPMVRSPYSNLFPDVVVAGADGVRRRGADGLLAAGFWDARWRWAGDASYVR